MLPRAEAKSPMSTDSNLDEAAAILAITHLEFDPVAQVVLERSLKLLTPFAVGSGMVRW